SQDEGCKCFTASKRRPHKGLSRRETTAQKNGFENRRRPRLFGRGHVAIGRTIGWRVDALLLEPNAVVLLGPVDVHLAAPHGLERTVHPTRTNNEGSQPRGKKKNSNAAENHRANLHTGDVVKIKQIQQKKPTRRSGGTADNDDPVDHFLARIEARGRRML